MKLLIILKGKKMKVLKDLIELIIVFLIPFLLFVFIIWLIVYGILYIDYKISTSRLPCAEVYIDNQLIYKGNSYHFETESRGSSTFYREFEKGIHFFPKITKEIISDNIKIKECSNKIQE